MSVAGLIAIPLIEQQAALAARGGGQSNNGCGLTGESGLATQNGRDLGAGTSVNGKTGEEGHFVSGGASGCS
jgi:hypothetical protein